MSKAELDLLATRLFKQSRIWYPHLTFDEADDLVAETLYRFARWPKKGTVADITYACHLMRTAAVDEARKRERRPAVVDASAAINCAGFSDIDPLEDLVPAEDEWGFVDSKVVISDAIGRAVHTGNQMDALECAISVPGDIPARHRKTLADVRKRLRQCTGLG